MSSTFDTGPISQAVEVADEAEHHTLVEKIEKAIEGAEEAVSHFVLGADKEGSKTENVNGSIENQINGESKEESADGAIGVPVEKTDSDIPVTSAPSIDPKDDVSFDVITSDEHTPTPIPNTESSKSEDPDIIHHNEESEDKSEEKSETAKEEILISSSDETQTEEHLGTDDTKGPQAVEVESVQGFAKEEPALLTHDGTEPHATPPTPEEIPPAPKHETEGEAAPTEAPIGTFPEHLEHSSLASDSEASTHTEPEVQGTVEPELDHTAPSDSAPAIDSEVELETQGDIKEGSGTPQMEEATVAEEERLAEVTQETLLETKDADEPELSQHEEVSIVEENPADLEGSEVIEAPVIQEKALEAEDKAEESAESTSTIDNHEVEDRTSIYSAGAISSEPSHDQLDAPVVDDHDVLAPDAAKGQSHTTNEEGPKEEASAGESKPETWSKLVEEFQPEVSKTEEALHAVAETTTEAISVSEEPQEEPPVVTGPKTEDHTPESPKEGAAQQETESTPMVEASVEENPSEGAATETRISAKVTSEVKEDEAPAEPGPAANVTPEKKETKEVHEEGAEVTALAENTKVHEEMEVAPVQKDEVSSEPPMIEEQRPEEQVILMMESFEYVEEPATPAAAEEAEHETEANGKEEVHPDEVKEEEPKSYDEAVQGPAPEANAEETKPEPELFTDETAYIEEVPVASETIDETPAPAGTEEHESNPEAEAAIEQAAPAEESAPAPATADEHSESTPVEERSEVLAEETDGESSAAVKSEEVKGEVSVVEEEPKAENKTSCSEVDEVKPEAEETKVEGNAVAEFVAETEETEPEHTNEPAGEVIAQAPLNTDTEVASEEPHVEATEIEDVTATEKPLEGGLAPVAEEPASEAAQISPPVEEEVLAEETPVVDEQAATEVPTSLEEAPPAQEASTPTEDSVVEEISIIAEKVSEEVPVPMVTTESKVEEAEAAPEVSVVNETTDEEAPDAENQQTEAASVEGSTPEESPATEATSALETSATEQTASGEVSTLMDCESAERQAAAEELVIEEVPTKVEETLAVEEPETELVTPAAEDSQIPSVEEVPATKQEPVAAEEDSTPEHLAAVNEPVTVLETPLVEEPHAPAIEEVPAEEPTVEHLPVVEEPVTEAPIPIIEEEQAIIPVIEEVPVDQPCVELATVEEPVAEAAAPVIHLEEVPASQIEEVPTLDEVPAIEEVPATATEEPEATEDSPAGAVTPAVEEQEVSTPVVEEVPAEEPLVEHHVVEEVDAPTPEVELVTATDDSPVEEPTSVEEPTTPTTEAIMPTVQGEEARAPMIEEIPVEQSLVEHTIVEEPVTETLTTSAPVQEEVPVLAAEVVLVDEPPAEHTLVQALVTKAPTTPTLKQEEISTPVIEEVCVKQPLVEHVSVEEPDTEAPPAPAPEQEEIPVPAIEEVPAEELVEHAPVEEPVTEVLPTPAPEQEEISTPAIEGVVEHVTKAPTSALEEEEISTTAIEEVSVENLPVEHALVDEPVMGAQTPASEQEEVSIPEVLAENTPVEQTLVEEPVTETVAPAVQEEEVITPPVEGVVEEPTVEQAIGEEPVFESPAPVIEQAQVSIPTIEEAPAEEPVTEAPTSVDEQEQVSTPAIRGTPVENPLVEVLFVGGPVTAAVTPDEEEQSPAPISEPPVQEPAVERAIPVEEPEAKQESPAGGAAIEESIPETSEVQSVEGDIVALAAGGKETPTPAEDVAKTAAVPEAQVPQEEPVEDVEDVEPAPTQEEALKTEAIDEPQAHVTEDVKQEPSTSLEVPQEQKEAEPATESHKATAATPDDHATYAEVAPIDSEKQAGSDVVEPEVVTKDQLVLVHEPKPEEGAPESTNVEEESAPEASAEDAAVGHTSESLVDVSAPIEAPSIFGGDVPSTKEEETELPLAPEAEGIDTEGVPEETVAANVPAEETAQEQRDFDAELAVAQALLSHPVSDVSSADEVIPQNPSEEQQPIEVLNETSTEMPEIPALVVTKTEENQPSHGDDFGVDATRSQKYAHELSKADAEPDEVITAPEPEALPVVSEDVEVGVDEDTREGVSDDGFEYISHADAIPDEQELTHGECATVQELQVDLFESTTPIPVACETAAAVADSAITVDPIDRSTVPTPIQVAAEIAAAVEDTAVGLDPTDRSAVLTPVPVASETAAAVEDTAATLDIDETRSKAPTPIPEAAETAAAVQDTAAILDPMDRSAVPTPIPVAAETAAAVEDTAATLDVDEKGLEVSPISEAAETAAAVEDTAVTLDATERSTVSTPIAEAAKTAADVEDTAATLDVDGDHSIIITPIPQALDVTAEVAEAAKELDLVSEPEVTAELPREEAQYSFRDTPRPASPLPETGAAVADSTPPADIEGAPTKAATPVPSHMAETPVTLEIEAADTTKAAEELDTASALPVSAIPREPIVNSPDDVAVTTPVTDAPKDEVVESTVEAAPVPQVIVEEDSKSNGGLSDNLLIAGAGLAGAALIGGVYAVTRDDKTEGVPMARTITNESSKSVHDKPLSFNGDHILPHMKEVGPQVAETEVHRAEIVRPTSNMLSKSVDAPAHDSELVGHEPRKDTDSALTDQLTEGQWLAQSHNPESIPKLEPAHTSKGKGPETRTPGSFPESIEEDEFVELLESSGHLQAPRMQRDLSGSSEFAESLISVDAISEALRYMRENNSEAAFRPPDIVVSEETTDGEHRTRNIVEVITPDTELITEPEPRRRDPSTRREQSRPSTRGSDMVSATHHKNLMENFWKLVFVGWLGGMGKFFVGLFGRKNGEQLGSVYANYARESQLMSQQNLNFEQHMGGSAKGKEKEKVRGGPREEQNKAKNGVNGNGVSASNGASGVKVKESRRGSIKKKWNAYRKKGD